MCNLFRIAYPERSDKSKGKHRRYKIDVVPEFHEILGRRLKPELPELIDQEVEREGEDQKLVQDHQRVVFCFSRYSVLHYYDVDVDHESGQEYYVGQEQFYYCGAFN